MFIVLSLFAAYLFFLGNAVAPRPGHDASAYEQAGLALGLGILLNYTLVLTGMELPAVLGVGAVAALIGIVRFVVATRGRWRALHAPRWQAMLWAACAAYVLALYYFQILSEPLRHWDARSIWFFHAKMIWAEGALSAAGGWNHPSVVFSHPDYPNLVPAIAAQLGYLRGYWNEFLPKGALWIVLAPLVLWVFSFRRASIAFTLLVALYFFSLHAWLWNGYMDAYLAMFFGVVLLLLGRYSSDQQEIDLYSAVVALGIAANTKNEGLVLALCVASLAVVGVIVAPSLSPRALGRRLFADRTFAWALLLAAVPTVLWIVRRMAWGLENDLTADLPAGLARARDRLSDGTTPQQLLIYLSTRATVAWLLMGLIVVPGIVLRWQRVKVHTGAILATAATAVYFAGVYFIYFITPRNLTWHLLTSATRVMAVVSFGLLITLYFQLTSLERESTAGQP